MIALAPTAAPLAATVAPSAAPSFAEKFIGKKMLHQNLSRFGYQDWEAFGTKIVGEREGYQSVSDALEALNAIAAPMWDNNKHTQAFAVVKNDAGKKFALVGLDQMLIWEHRGKVYGDNTFRVFDAAVVAAVNGAGDVLNNLGKVHWWN